MPKMSKWQAQHKGCQKAVDDLKADLTAEIERLQEAWETADSVAQMAAHGRDEALENFAQVEQEYGYLLALLQRARVSLMGLMDAGTWSNPRGFRIDAEAALSEAHATIREIEEATDIGDQDAAIGEEYRQQLAEDAGPQPDEMVRLQMDIDSAEAEVVRLQRLLKVATSAFDEIEGDLGKLLGLTRTEMHIEAVVKRARARIDGDG